MKVIPVLLIILFINACTQQPQEHSFPFQNAELSFEQRVDDLVGRMTLEEKIGQMVNEAPAIGRLGIPQYNWWNECLHGVARAGLAAVYPQAIGLGATWDEDLIFRMATTISDEARAKYHNVLKKKNRSLIFQGLTFWSPNINIFRDPRWGRGQETYGEDPFLTGKLAVQFIKGLQGDDPKYFKTISTVKHYAVHSGPEPERHAFNAVADERDFRETYLPQFEMGIKEGKAYSVMCAYNRFQGEACCGSDRLLIDILRNEWGFNGYVVSDCGAIRDIYANHKIVESPEEAAALAVKSGCDLECGQVYEHLSKAVRQGLISEQEIDVAVKRLFTARFRLGMFDPPEMVKYAQIPYEVLDCQEHRKLALQVARESIVLLKNENNLLPLDRNIKTIAVIGPNADQWQVLLGNYNGVPADPLTPLRGIKEKVSPATKVLYTRGCELVKQSDGDTRVEKSPTRSETELLEQAVETAGQADVVVLCMGLSPRLEGEEMPVNIDGFRGGDRTRLDLPQVQQDLIKTIQALAKPVVLVLLNGSAVAVNWENENIPAIVETWYGGQAAGQAVADVLFGDYNPAGRLPVTFYKAIADLPPFEEYAMNGRTYRFFKGEPLYSFGYGLSYTTFKYANLKVKHRQQLTDPILIAAEVKNTGKMAGDEVAEVYLSRLNATVPVPIRSLVGFKRIHLLPNEVKTVNFSISPTAFSVINSNDEREILLGEFEIFVGGRQPQGVPDRDSGILTARINLL